MDIEKYLLTSEEIEAIGEEYDKEYNKWWRAHTKQERMDLKDFPEIEERIAKKQVEKVLRMQAESRPKIITE